MKRNAATLVTLWGLSVVVGYGCAMDAEGAEKTPIAAATGALEDEAGEEEGLFGDGPQRRRCRRLRRQCRRSNETSCASYSQECAVRIGVVGDSLSDEYQGVSSQLPGIQWTTQVQEDPHIWLGVEATNPEPRNDGWNLNWARYGQAANSPQWSELDPPVRAACLGGADDPRLLTIPSLDAQIDGLGAQIQSLRVDVALVWVGHNDLFIAGCTGQDPADPVFVAQLIGRIVSAALDLQAYADDGAGAPRAKVAIIGLAGSASAINPALSAAAAAEGITFIDSFNDAVAAIVGEQAATVDPVNAPDGFYDVGGTPLVPFDLEFVPEFTAVPRAATLTQLSSTGTGPCSAFPTGSLLCSTPAYAEPYQHWDEIHPNTLYMGVIGNRILTDLNGAFGFAMQTISEEQLLDTAGL
ncbi:MAG: hypothetical protein OXR73_38220 [Myxococcales bacterium]|nr:hypothetical protein [Myxococcales bacterium]